MRTVVPGFLLSLVAGAALAATLTPMQERALGAMLATMDAPMRATMRPQLEAMLASLDDAQVQALLDSMQDDSASMADTIEEPYDEEAAAYHRAQYEPALKRAWSAEKAFDQHVDAAFAAHCPEPSTYAVWGQAWRFAVMPLAPNWARASASAEADVEILGPSYAPQDGRYRFDFSGMRESFDRDAVTRAVARACGEYRRIGEAFLAEAKAKVSDESLEAGGPLEDAANRDVSALNVALEKELAALAPNAKNAVLMAMLNGRPE